MRWSWKGPLVLVGLIALVYFVFTFATAIAMLVVGQGQWAAALIMASGCFPLALFIGSGFAAAKVEEFIQRRKSK